MVHDELVLIAMTAHLASVLCFKHMIVNSLITSCQ
jgi:hypothetical protein